MNGIFRPLKLHTPIQSTNTKEETLPSCRVALIIRTGIANMKFYTTSKFGWPLVGVSLSGSHNGGGYETGLGSCSTLKGVSDEDEFTLWSSLCDVYT